MPLVCRSFCSTLLHKQVFSYIFNYSEVLLLRPLYIKTTSLLNYFWIQTRPLFVSSRGLLCIPAGCEECMQTYDEECPIHKLLPMPDKIVFSRAWASLPPNLQIFRVGVNDSCGKCWNNNSSIKICGCCHSLKGTKLKLVCLTTLASSNILLECNIQI